ncbi:hypothetical protein AGMMS49991_02610 [Spirochaetia bacterium]|nr:hypothetical protein AGMMS49991_02610 [Spirochaetia bacterium]
MTPNKITNIVESADRKNFSLETEAAAWRRANGKCEDCGRTLIKDDRGNESEDSWQAHHEDGNPSNNEPDNCKILCFDCHSKTPSYGRANKN